MESYRNYNRFSPAIIRGMNRSWHAEIAFDRWKQQSREVGVKILPAVPQKQLSGRTHRKESVITTKTTKKALTLFFWLGIIELEVFSDA
jgi:hypothetical protein